MLLLLTIIVYDVAIAIFTIKSNTTSRKLAENIVQWMNPTIFQTKQRKRRMTTKQKAM